MIVIAGACSTETGLKYPVAEKEMVADTYFGKEVADPYRWLEDDTSEKTADWVTEQNKVTQAYLMQIPFRDRLKQRLTALMDYERIGAPIKKNGKYYFFKNDGLQNQSVLYVKASLDGTPAIVLDPNRLSDDGTVALTDYAFSKDGSYLAYCISRSGSDWNEIYVINLATGQHTGDHLLWSKFGGPSWQGNGFYYSAYDAPEAGREYSNMNENHTIYYHKLGEPQSQDQTVYRNPKEPKRFYYGSVSEDERVLFIYESGAEVGNNLFMKDLTRNGSEIIPLTEDMNFVYNPVEVVGDKVFFLTNFGAPRYKIMVADIRAPKLANWKDMVPETESVLTTDVQVIGGNLVLIYEKDASHHAFIHSLDGKRLHEVTLPTLGSVYFSGNKDDKETFYVFTSFTFPPTIYQYDPDTNASEPYMAPKVAFNPEDYTTEQVFYPGKDGTKIPMFLTYQKGLSRNGNNPVLLYGYGGFNISLTPSFSTNRLAFLENGGIFAQANLRGGSEYGEEWHQAGIKMKKQNVFDDFIAAGEYLIREKYTQSSKLAIQGGSNGGLLVGAAVNQRPDLFQVALPAVGVMDMLRYHKFTIGWNWASDYGTSEDSKEMFEYLYAYSPLHNIRDDRTSYPAILITTADHDDRVVPAHSFKYAATLQAANTGGAPKLIRIETNAGHGAGKPVSKVLDEYTDMFAFLMFNLGMKP
jgi:prolyl oligopeptidase